MTQSTAQQLHQMIVRNDYDVVAMRQDVRQQARLLGLGLIHQAKLATAISAIARGLLAIHPSPVFTMQMTTEGPRRALEIACIAELGSSIGERTQLEEALHFEEARMLVDEASLALGNHEARLTLRMWLGNSPA